MGLQSSSLDAQILAHLARTAACVLDPLCFIHDDHAKLNLLDENAIRKLASYGTFKRPINQALSKRLSLQNLSLPSGWSERLKTDEDLKTAVHLLHCEGSVFYRFAKFCAAVQLYPQIKSCVLKSHRKQMETILGSEAFFTSIRETRTFFPNLPKRSEAVLLNPHLDGLDAQIKSQKETGSTVDQSGPAVHSLVWEGFTTLISFAARADKVCGKLLALRLPIPPKDISLNQKSLSDTQVAELKTLLKRRGFAC